LEYASSAVLQQSPEDEPPSDGGRPSSGRGRRDPLWAKLLVILGALLMMGSGVLIVIERVAIAEADRSVTQDNLLGNEGAQANDQHATITGPKNILLVGLDNRPGQDPNVLVRADSIIILHIATTHDRAYMVSIPRDTWVQIPANPQTKYYGGSEKINAAFAFGNQNGGGARGGVQLLAKTIRTLYGIRFDAAAIVDFTGFEQVVKALGGVCMYVDEKTTSVHLGFKTGTKTEAQPYKLNPDTGKIVRPIRGVTPMVYNVGNHCFPAYQALDYVRQRELLADGDYGRQRHQKQFLKAVFKKVLSTGTLTNLSKLNRVLGVIGKAMTVDTGAESLGDWIFAMRGISADDLTTIKTNNGGFHSDTINGRDVETLDADTLATLQAFRTDTVDQFLINHQNLIDKTS
jgi:polyisoprenyl-teichoic acid--peptidoglycan teichoic acid transferase